MLKNSKNEKFPRAANVKIVEFRKTKKKQRAKVRGIRKVLEFSKSFEILIYGKCEKFGGNTSVTSSSEKGRRTLGET